MAILRQKAETDGLYLPDEVIQYIAGNMTSNVRELEGTLIKLIASSAFTGKDITLDVAKEICGDMISRKDQRITIQVIQQKVAASFNSDPTSLPHIPARRTYRIPAPLRCIYAKNGRSSPWRTIGLDFGGRDYSTVIHSFKKIEAEILVDDVLRKRIETIEEQLKALA